MTTLTQGDILDYVMENKGDKVFPGWTIDQILEEIRRSIGDNTFLYCVDTRSGDLIGIVTARKLEDKDGNRIMHITSILTTRKKVLREFYFRFRQMYPEYKLLQSNRRKKVNRLVLYRNLRRFGKLIERLG